MAYKLSVVLHFPDEAPIQRARELLFPLYQNAILINEGQDNEEWGFIELERCAHDEQEHCEVLARWEVGRGKVFPVE